MAEELKSTEEAKALLGDMESKDLTDDQRELLASVLEESKALVGPSLRVLCG